MTPDTTWFTDPAQISAAMRDATLSSLDGAQQLNKEVADATLKGWDQARKEASRLADAQGKALKEGLQAQQEAADKALGWFRDQVAHAGAPTSKA